MDTSALIPCIGGPLHGMRKHYSYTPKLRMECYTKNGKVEHVYQLELYTSQNKKQFFWVHPDATDAEIDHALGLADI